MSGDILKIAVDNSPVDVFKEQFFKQVYDQILISEIHGEEEDIPQDVMNHAFVAILIQILVLVASSRDVVDPERLRRLLKVEISKWSEVLAQGPME
jgi:hypothetical protein